MTAPYIYTSGSGAGVVVVVVVGSGSGSLEAFPTNKKNVFKLGFTANIDSNAVGFLHQ